MIRLCSRWYHFSGSIGCGSWGTWTILRLANWLLFECLKHKLDARKHRSSHDRMQMMVIVGSALATSLTGATIFTLDATTVSIVLKLSAAFFSLVVTIASGSMAYFKYKERSNDTQKAADTIEDDHSAVKLGTGVYRGKPLEEALSMFAENTNRTISDHKKKQQLLDQPPDAKSGQASQ